MSLINKMLQDLDRRQAGGPVADGAMPAHVHTVAPEPRGREWFWRVLAVLMAIALGWVAWVAYQMWPRPIVTELAYQSADHPRDRAAPLLAAAPAAPEAPPAIAAAPAPAPSPDPADSVAVATPAAAPEVFRLAQTIETPITEPAPKPAAKAAQKEVQPKSLTPKALPKAAPAALADEGDAAKVERRDRVVTPAERAENEFRYAAAVLKLGRAAEAESHFARALDLNAHHQGARQALVAMRLERGLLDSARGLLEEGLRAEPGQPEFSVALARILIERKDLPGALSALDGASANAAGMPEYHVLRATVLQRLGRHTEAADAYRAALRQQPANPPAWVGLGISLEALEQRREAAEAFRQALAAGPVNPDVKTFVEQRLRALR
jgi:MSHA biogenesis protein MshN